MRIATVVILAAACGALAQESPDEAFWLGGEGYAHKPTVRQEVFEFAAEPAVRLAGRDQYEVAFAAKGLCDATVAIVRRTDGRIVRHLASGVLGPNAPAPLVANSLEQKLLWDGKDDQGKYVRNVADCQVRVSLGLKPAFAGLFGWNPKDNTGQIQGLAAAPEGVYVLEGGLRPQVRLFDHAGNYVRTVFPPPADFKWDDMKGAPTLRLPDGQTVLRHQPYGGMLPEGAGLPCQTMAVARGRLVVGNSGKSTAPKQLLKIATATGGPVDGQQVCPPLDRPGEELAGSHCLAFSPDAKWVYVSGLTIDDRHRGVRLNAIYRLPFDAIGRLPRDAFFGEDGRAGKDALHLNSPRGVCTDAAGRVFIADAGNGRIVALSPEGKFLQAVPAAAPRIVQVHQKTGALYVLGAASFGAGPVTAIAQTLTKLAGLDDPKPLARMTVTGEEPRGRSLDDIGLMCLDSWAETPTVWLTTTSGGLVLLADRGDKFEAIADWKKEVAAAGLIPGEMYGGRMPKVVADPVRPFVYYHPNGWANSHPFRFNTETGKAQRVQLPSPADDIAFDAAGRLYCRAFRCLSRHDPETMEEIPFDYGEPLTARYSQFQGALPLNDMPGAKVYQDGFGVGVDGRIAVVSNIFTWEGYLEERRGTSDMNVRVSGTGSDAEYARAKEQFIGIQTRLPLSPGRNVDRQGTVWVYDARGQLIARDILKGPVTGTIGAGIDRDGAVYVAANMTKVVAGKSFLPGYPNGSLLKAPLTGARIDGDWGRRARVPLERLPDRPHDFSVFVVPPTPGGGQSERRAEALRHVGSGGGVRMWQNGLLWAYPGASEIMPVTSGCTCPTLRFGLDYFARSFVPEAYRFSVAVVDTNGNRVCHVGRYGNADSGRGPDSPVKVGGDELAFAFPSFVSVIDDYLFVSDSGSDRIVRVKLGYHQQRELELPSAAEAR